MVYLNTGKYEQAISAFDTAIKLNPNYVSAYTRRGVLLYLKAIRQRPLLTDNTSIRLDPNYAEAYDNRGTVYEAKMQFDLAISDYTDAIRLDPNYARAYRRSSRAYAAKELTLSCQGRLRRPRASDR